MSAIVHLLSRATDPAALFSASDASGRIEGRMLHLTSGPVLVVEIGLALFCFFDCLICPEPAVRWVPRWGWVLFLLAFPLGGTIMWLVAGHPWRRSVRVAAAAAMSRPHEAAAEPSPDQKICDEPELVLDLDRIAADDITPPRVVPAPQPSPDARLAEELLAVHEEHERTLQAWENDLRRREAALRDARGQKPAA